MKDLLLEDTIAAISTPPFSGAIAIIRLSGSKSFDIAKAIFRTKEKFDSISPRFAAYGKIYESDNEIDEVILIKFSKQNSYTNEDMVEINCHGGIYVSRKILELVVKFGARIAAPGEFTLRAFLNGRIDLTRAEAVSDLIRARTQISHLASLKQLQGALSEKIDQIREEITTIVSLIELELDFSEEEVEFVKREEMLHRVHQTEHDLTELIATYETGRIAREGVKLVITGKPNVGKSSLLNRLANEERAIVTDIPGTTRDSLEVQLDINGVLFKIVDTAGIKTSLDPIERESIRRAERHLQSADIILHVFDGSKSIDEDDVKVMNKISRFASAKVFRIINKADIQQNLHVSEIRSKGGSILSVSALTGHGIDQLISKVFNTVIGDASLPFRQAAVTNVRHFNLLKKALACLIAARGEIEKDVSPEFISLYLREALDHLGEIIGKVTSEDILNNIFSKFCIGK